MGETKKKRVLIKKEAEITEELAFLKKYKFVAWGAGQYWGKIFIHFVENLQLTLLGFCDNNPDLWGTDYGGYPVFSPEEFVAMVKEEKNLMVQVTVDQQHEESVAAQLNGYGVAHIIPSFQQDSRVKYYKSSLIHGFAEKYKDSLSPEVIASYDTFSARVLPSLQTNKEDLEDKERPILICHPAKTADTTLVHTFLKEKIPYSMCMHHSKILQSCDQRTKVTMAIREPIIRDLSELFEGVSKGGFLLSEVSFPEFHRAITEDDYQYIFDLYINRPLPSITYFFEQCKINGLDVLAHPFDKEKGYTIFQTGNFDVFFFQLEKLNNLISELSAWTGTEFTELVNSNVAADKWVADSYKKAQKTIKLTQEYFDQCYNDPYVQHCYSQKDIEQFKDHWRGNIQS